MDAVKRRVPIDNDNENLAQMTLRARQCTHAMPRVRLSSEQQAAIAECFRNRNALEFLKVRGRPILEAPTSSRISVSPPQAGSQSCSVLK
jgi:hypothetical protein